MWEWSIPTPEIDIIKLIQHDSTRMSADPQSSGMEIEFYSFDITTHSRGWQLQPVLVKFKFYLKLSSPRQQQGASIKCIFQIAASYILFIEQRDLGSAGQWR